MSDWLCPNANLQHQLMYSLKFSQRLLLHRYIYINICICTEIMYIFIYIDKLNTCENNPTYLSF